MPLTIISPGPTSGQRRAPGGRHWQNVPAIERFEESYTPEPMSGCWLWIGALAGKGYGSIQINGRKFYAHRFAWEQFRGPIPERRVIDHKCRNHQCVNPDHLEPVTNSENLRRGDLRAANVNAQKTFCPRGHSYSGDNLYVRPGHRSCRACRAIERSRRDEQIRRYLKEYRQRPEVKERNRLRLARSRQALRETRP